MEQGIKISFTDKLYYFIILLFCFGMPFFIFIQFGFENKQKSILIPFFGLFFIGIYSIFKIHEISKSIFVYCPLKKAEIELIISKLGLEKNFKILPSFKSNITRLYYKKYALGLDYEIHFYIHENQIEFNAFCNQSGILDFGTRKRILKHIKNEIELNCSRI